MLIYDRKGDSINVYNLVGKTKEIKRYRSEILERYKNKLGMFFLKTNNPCIKSNFESFDNISIYSLDYNFYDSMGPGDYSELMSTKWKEELIINYLNGCYDRLLPIAVWKGYPQKDVIYRFLKTQFPTQTLTGDYVTWEFNFDGIIDLPEELYLLQLLMLGRYDLILNDEIQSQLKLFDLDLVNNFKITDIKDLMSSKLIQGSFDEILDKVKISENILAKRK